MPVPEAVQVAAPPARLVVFQMCCPAGMPKPPKHTQAVLVLFGSITARLTYRVPVADTGNDRLVTSVRVLDPVWVIQTWPLLVPMIRTLSSWGEMPIALSTPLAETGFWLAVVCVAPWSA